MVRGQIHYLIAKRTLDEQLFETLERKTCCTSGILDGQSKGLEVADSCSGAALHHTNI